MLTGSFPIPKPLWRMFKWESNCYTVYKSIKDNCEQNNCSTNGVWTNENVSLSFSFCLSLSFPLSPSLSLFPLFLPPLISRSLSHSLIPKHTHKLYLIYYVKYVHTFYVCVSVCVECKGKELERSSGHDFLDLIRRSEEHTSELQSR